MTASYYDISVDATEVEEMLAGVRLRMSNQRIPGFLGNVVAEYLRRRVDERFRDEGDDVSGKWADLRARTASIRKSQGYGPYHPINRRTGGLYRFVKTFRVAKSADPVLTMPGLRGGSKLMQKLTVAQVGGFAPSSGLIGPPRPIVPRPVIGLGGEDATHITNRLQRWIMEAS
jgi:hypothetical protein